MREGRRKPALYSTQRCALSTVRVIQGPDNGWLEIGACLGVKNIGKPCAGKPHARFDEGGQVQACSLLYPAKPPNFKKVASYSGRWTNYDSDGTGASWNNTVAFLGGRYNNKPRKYADFHHAIALDHVAICYQYCRP